ncbi:hypothetical protein [Escherichia phage ZCEC12]|nr:hypothetical protein P9622_gp39 [Escherichia phage ZCEC10]UJQ87870.1 hypothetical protein [Escherichia phage ZCEC11]UJQ87960.1 hypothetical protein [Escherichia phage ZCEC12]UJQ88033.1 hypothetical protein [Escherichia phage ZCEC10]
MRLNKDCFKIADTMSIGNCIKRGLHNGRSSGRHHAEG